MRRLLLVAVVVLDEKKIFGKTTISKSYIQMGAYLSVAGAVIVSIVSKTEPILRKFLIVSISLMQPSCPCVQ